jgi:hypothetical protein
MAPQEQTISWSVSTHTHKERSTDWYWAFALITLAGIGVSIFFANYMLAVILFVGMGSISILAVRGPREHSVRIDKRGIAVDGTLYPFRTIQSFWVEIEDAHEDYPDYEPRARLFLTTSGILSPHMTVPLDNAEHARQVREYLRHILKEEEQHPHFAEHVAEILGL